MKKQGKPEDSEAASAAAGDCGMCKKSISNGVAQCGFCEEIYCAKCSNFTDHMCKKVLIRADVLWACYNCFSRLENAKLATPLSDAPKDSTQEIIADGNAVLRKFQELQGEINSVKTQMSEVVSGVESFSSNVEKQMRQVMNEALFGEEYPEFDPSISLKQAKRIAKEQNMPPPPTLNDVMKTAVNEQNKAEKKENEDKAIARCNIIIYGMNEPSETDGEKRKKFTDDKMTELLSFLEVDEIKPIKTHRLGKFTESNENQASKPRPLKVILSSQAEAEMIVKSCKKLKDAPTNLSGLSVSHDLTNEERINIRNLVKKAKEDSAKSPNLDFKVVGPPWKPTIRSYNKRAPNARE